MLINKIVKFFENKIKGQLVSNGYQLFDAICNDRQDFYIDNKVIESVARVICCDIDVDRELPYTAISHIENNETILSLLMYLNDEDLEDMDKEGSIVRQIIDAIDEKTTEELK